MAQIGIRHIVEFRPSGRLGNKEIAERFGFDELFLSKKIGIEERPVAGPNEYVSDLCVSAIARLTEASDLAIETVDCIAVVTQTPDRTMPNVASIVHGKLGLPKSVAAFDINLGCSGFVYGLSVLKGFMAENGLRNSVLLTAEAYSKIMDPEDRNTVPLFGDAATATWLSAEDPIFHLGRGEFGTDGASRDVVHTDALTGGAGKLVMDGREIFNFMMREVPGTLDACLEKNGMRRDEVDLWVFHQASRFMLEALVKRLGLDPDRVPIDVAHSGNTVSSTIPFILARRIFEDRQANRPAVVVLCGFGVGLSWGTLVLKRAN